MDDKQLRILLVEDSEDDAVLLLRELERGGYAVACERVQTRAAMKKALAAREWDIVISDYRMPRFSAPQALETLKESGLDLPFIIVSGKIAEDMLVDAMRAGANDYFIKGNLSRLIPAIERELREAAERRIRRRAERAIRQGKMEWEAAFDAVSDLVLLTDLYSTVIRCNNRVIEAFSATYSDILGRNITELFYGSSDAGESVFVNCTELRPDDGDVRFPKLTGWYKASCFPMHPTEHEHGFVYVIEDVTKRKKMEEEKELATLELLRSRQALRENLEEMKRANLELGRLNAAKNTFIGMASHELKTPLTSIVGGLQFLLHYSGLEMTPEQKEMMESVYEGVTQLRGIVDDLLSISRIETKGFAVAKRMVNLLNLCREVRHTLLLPLSERDIELSIAEDTCSVPADEGFCRLVTRNLLENAIKFTADGGRITITGQLTSLDDLLPQADSLRCFYREFPSNIAGHPAFYRLDIADTGIGIPPEERVRIFEKFYGVGDIAYHSSGKTGFMSKG
ncbi:hybrid sensor histidine kinase/response regulator, partial [bacterium]|nr:hybrid sensor histidine kinase/response regulator [bacterium]